jgi:hypothetical protein
MQKILFLALLCEFCLFPAKGQTLYRVYDNLTENYGYADADGNMVIPFGTYSMCFTDTFNRLAIVTKAGEGIVGIDKDEKVLFHVWVFDNGPDDPHEGLFRIVENGKIGYADTTGKIVIKPQYDCAYPFENGRAKVGKGCKTTSDGEHNTWVGGEWSEIDRQGKLIK